MSIRLPRFLQRICLGLLLTLLSSVHSGIASAQSATEAELKAAIIANMLIFVEWPAPVASAAGLLRVCYLEESPVSTALSMLDGKNIKGKTLKVVHADADVASGCHALYFPPGNSAKLRRLLPKLNSDQIFLVGDSAEYIEQGIMLNLELSDGRIVFDIDLRFANKAGLVISSKALRLARKVFS